VGVTPSPASLAGKQGKPVLPSALEAARWAGREHPTGSAPSSGEQPTRGFAAGEASSAKMKSSPRTEINRQPGQE